MITNPIITLANSGFKLANKVWTLPNVYSLTVQSNASGTASSDAMIGTENYSTNLYATPAEGYRLSGWNTTGGTVNNNVFTFGNDDATIEPVFEENIVNITAGWTIRVTGDNMVVATMDPAGGESKLIYETVTQLNDDLSPMQGGFVSSFRGSYVWSNDQFAAFAPSAGIYNSIWDNASSYSSNHAVIYCNFGESNTANITDVYTMDFFNQEKEIYKINFFRSTSSLPQRAEDIIGANRISALNSAFTGFKNVKTPVIPFITAWLSVLPSSAVITTPLKGSCTASPDYEQAIAQYPEWF